MLWGRNSLMSETVQTPSASGWRAWLSGRMAELRQRERQIFLVLALVIGAATGLVVVAFIVLTERMGMRLYPVGGAPWRRLLFPVVGSLGIGYLLYRFFRMRGAAASTDEGCIVRARRAHHAAHRARQVFLHFGDAGERNSAGT